MTSFPRMETPKVNVADVAADQHSQERPEGRDLPIELWLTIAQSLRLDVDQHFPSYPVRLFDMRALKNLRLVSQTMKDVIEPLYWERVELSANTRPREAMEAVKHLKANPVHRGYVKYMVLKRWRAEHLVHRWGDDRENEPTSETLSGLFTSMRNLRAIHFEWMYLTPEMFAHLYALPHLQCVVFLHLPTIPPSVSLDCGTLPMSTFTLDRVLSSHITDSSDSLGIATCVNLFVNPAKLETLQISFRVAPVLYRFAEEVTFDSLREFEGPEPSVLHEIDLVYKFMRSCPNLECINITPRITDGVLGLDSIPSPPDDVLGQLQSFQGTLSLAARIVPSRPVEKLYVSCRSEHAHTHAFGPALQRLATSSKSIRVLHLKLVGLNDDHLSLVASNLPLLEELEIGLTGHIITSGEKNGTKLDVDQLQPLSRLQSFTLKNTVWDPNDRREIPEPLPTMADGPSQLGLMRILTQNHPLLEYVEVGQTVRWQGDCYGWTWRSLSECGTVLNFDAVVDG